MCFFYDERPSGLSPRTFPSLILRFSYVALLPPFFLSSLVFPKTEFSSWKLQDD